MELLQANKQVIFIPVTRIEAYFWKHPVVYSQFETLRVRSAFSEGGELCWTENFGKELNPIFDKIKTFEAKRSVLTGNLKKIKEKNSPEAKVIKNKLKPFDLKLKKFMQALKALG